MRISLKKCIPLALLVLILGLPFMLRFIPEGLFQSSTKQRVIDISWRDLRQLDFQTGQMSDALRELENQLIKIPGFIVPLVDDAGEIAEFLLVPSPQACIHVPPPPPNQMVHVYLRENIQYESQYRAVYVTGRLQIASATSQYGFASFTLDGLKVERFRAY